MDRATSTAAVAGHLECLFTQQISLLCVSIHVYIQAWGTAFRPLHEKS